ncbi:phosphoenolpyruvate synthase [Alkalimarinus coralli]|uniref:phosphoenolpyruvate synthase n=1 Tax=Alkalimarinus coralli TaxID=2935863 RepID=UPI00202B87E2|nr:phosphoenolpyruvate synthase [Alkalimarinus coralli]
MTVQSEGLGYVLSSKGASSFSENTLGGKASQMAWLTRNGFNVPEWFVITTEAFNGFVSENKLGDWIDEKLKTLSDQNVGPVSEEIRNKLLSGVLPCALEEQISESLATMPNGVEDFYAVRSSVVGEDAASASFAGQMDSELFQKGIDAITHSVKSVFASAFTERALIYRLHHNIDYRNIKAAVIVQRMIFGSVSGVMFTAHPINGRRDQGLISACYGAGEGIVSGLCSTDEYTASLDAREVESTINEKDIQLVFDEERGLGTIEKPVPEALKNKACLTNEQVKQLIRTGKSIAEARLFPQDIEWTVESGVIYILQTRPVTSMPPPEKPKGDRIVWDNSNIQESYCGVTTPLTFSFANRAYATVYEQTMRLMGISEKEIQKNQGMLRNMLGLIKGRVYYNINNWYRGLLFLPSFGTNKEAMERMMGLQDPVDMIQDTHLSAFQKLKKLPGMLKALIILLSHFVRMGSLVDQFKAMFQREYNAIPRTQLHTLEMAELMALTKQLDNNLLNRWTTPIVNDFYVMIYNGKVNSCLTKVGIENAEVVQNNLLSGEEGIESTEPTKMLLRMCSFVRSDKSLKALINGTENQYLLDAIQVQSPEFYLQCLEYIELYGDRTIGELKLESVSLRQDPSFMFAVLKNFLSREDLSEETLSSNETAFRQEAEQEAFGKIEQQLGAKKLATFKVHLAKLRDAIKHRENMRLARTRMFGLYRDIYIEIGRQLQMDKQLDEARDILYLTVEELDAYMEGRSVSSLNDLAQLRKKEFASYEQEELPHHFSTWGPVYHHNSYEYKGGHEALDADSDELSGLGCYPGIVEQPVRLIFSPEDELSLDGQILCTVRTDPGWAPLFPTAGGLLVERGSTLSHSAVVARELGIPAIVNIPGITKIINDGERVKMDGAKGTIQRLDTTTETV